MYTDFFFFNDTATTEIYTLSLHDALPICAGMSGRVLAQPARSSARASSISRCTWMVLQSDKGKGIRGSGSVVARSEKHTSELQSRQYLVCRLLLEKKKQH